MTAPSTLPVVTLTATAPTPTSLLLPTIIATSVSPVSATVTLQNHSSSPLSVTLTLSANLRPLLSLATYYTATPPQPSPAASANLNLLHRSTTSSLPLTLPPHSSTPHPIHFVPSLAAPAHASLTTLSSISGRLLLHLPPRRSPLSSLKLSATLSLSRLLVSPPSLPFGHIPALVESTQALNVRNVSPVPTSFLLSASSLDLTFLHARKRTRLPRAAIRVPPFASRRVLCAVRPHAPGSLNATVAVEDVHNPHAMLRVAVTAVVAPPVAGAFETDCGPELHFGDCYSSCSVYKDIAVTSKTSHRISLSFASNRRQQVTFELLPQWSLDSEAVDMKKEPDAMITPWREDLVRGEVERPMSRSHRAFSGALQLPIDDGASSVVTRYGSGSSLSTQQQPSTSAEAMDADGRLVASIASKTRLTEQVTLAAGETRTVRVWFLPLVLPTLDAFGPSSDLDRGRLRPDSFQIIFKLSSEESRVVEGKARVCESMLRLERNETHLGNCDVLTQYPSSVSIINCSDLRASATIDYVSQSVVADNHEIVIEPRKAFDVALTFVPRQVNPNYHKEITVTNKRNPEHPSLVFTLRANCIDGQGVSLHALFYKILAPTQTNEIDFGVTVANHMAIRAFKVRNITQGRLRLKFNGAKGIKTYVPTQRDNQPANASVAHENSDKIRSFTGENVSDQKSLPGLKTDACDFTALRNVNALVEDHIYYKGNKSGKSLRLKRRAGFGDEKVCTLNEGERKAFGEFNHLNSLASNHLGNSNTGLRTVGESRRSWESFLRQLTERDYAMLDSMPMFFSNYASEMSYSDRQFRPARRLQGALQDGLLEDTGIVTLGAGAEQLLVVTMNLCDMDVKGKTKTRPIEKELTVQMLEFDHTRFSDAAPTNSKEVNRMARLFEVDGDSMPRALILTVHACKSRMKIAPLSQLNFGRIACGEQKDKTFSIVNLSEAPLLYEIRKANAESSDQLRFNLGKGTRGVVRPYLSKTVPFIYTPTIEGMFEEKIVIENRLDRSANCELVVKAAVAKALPLT